MSSVGLPPVQTAHRDTMYYLFGYPISKSLSPFTHQVVYDHFGINAEQALYPCTDLDECLRVLRSDPKCNGAAVTMPHKVNVLAHLDELTEQAREVGACNTVYVRYRDGKKIFIGTNTDVIGVREAFAQNVRDPAAVYHNRPGMVIGGGGAARSAIYAMRKWMKCSPIYIVNRLPHEVDAVIAECAARGIGGSLIHVATAAQAAELVAPGAVVSCVPDFPPVTEGEKETRRVIEVMLAKEHKGAWLEMAYHPKLETELACLAAGAGWQVMFGTQMMMWQALEQERLWQERENITDLPVEKVKEAIMMKLSQPRLV